MGILKYANPLWYPYAFVCWTYRVLKGIFWMPFKIAAKFDAWWKKAIVFAGAVYVAIPGSIPFTLLKLAEAVGYEEEAQFVMDVAISVAKAAYTAGALTYNFLT